jgi:hypothetical protein
MSSTAVANLYLKWRAFRDIVSHPHSDAQIAEAIYGANDGAVKFSKLLYGDYGCSNEVAAELGHLDLRRRRQCFAPRSRNGRAHL